MNASSFFDKLWVPNTNPSANSIRTKLESILEHLLEWSKKKFGNLLLYIKKLREQLNKIHSQITWSTAEEVKLELELEPLLSLEEDCWKTGSRVDWLMKGDRNTTYFHPNTSQRHKRIPFPKSLAKMVSCFLIRLK